MVSSKHHVFFVVPFKSSFIRSDIDIIGTHYTILLNHYNWKKKFLIPILMFKQLLSPFKNRRQLKFIIVEFGGYWSLIPSVFGRLFRVPVLIILHGTDTASMPSVSYGSLRKKFLKFVCKISYRYATMLVPVSDSLIFTENNYSQIDKFQGVNYFFPDIKTPIRVVYNGLDADFWRPAADTPKQENRVLAVFFEAQFFLKGGDLIVQVSKNHPELSFYIAGSERPAHLDEDLQNVHFLGRLTPEELREECGKLSNYTRRQDCPKVYEYNVSVYVINANSSKLSETMNFPRRMKFVMDSVYAVDLDDIEDWECAEYLYQKMFFRS